MDDEPNAATELNDTSRGADFDEIDDVATEADGDHQIGPLVGVPADLSGLPAAATGAPGPDDYGPTLTHSGAAKMVDSAVAPLIAVARGYTTVTRATLRETAAHYGLGQMNSRHGRQLAANVGEHDAMMMPWYSPEDVSQAERRRAEGADPADGLPRFSTLQVRPSELSGRLNERGQRLKYDIFSGQSSVLGVHPATPISWLRDAPVLFVTEGAIKGDSALSGLLRHHGVTKSQLAATTEDTQATALLRLHDLMESIPVADRVLIVTVVGVGNWHSNPDWNSFRLKDRIVWIAFDGDVASNIHVWYQADQMWTFLAKRHAQPRLLDLHVATEGPDGQQMMHKVGADDYLAKIGDWRSLTTLLSPSLPARPIVEAEPEPGDWRVNDKNKTCEELTQVEGDFGPVPRWVPRAHFSARITATETSRFVRESELRTGMLEDTIDGGLTNSTEVAFEWVPTAPGDVGSAIVRGPGTMMADPPDQWHRRGATVPPELANHPDWPPRNFQWAAAIKRHRREETLRRAAWNQMGWVPTKDDGMVYIAGRDVIGREGRTHAALPGVDDKLIGGATKFGLNPPENDDQAREAIRDVLDAYLACPWNDRRVAAVVLAAALRPTVPVTPRCPILISGPRRRGKALPMDASIPVPVGAKFPSGWALNSDLEIGDEVYGSDGRPVRIRRFSEVVTDHPVYRLTFADGRAVDATGEHLWKVIPSALSPRSAATCRGFCSAGGLDPAELRAIAAGHHAGDATTIDQLSRLTRVSVEHVVHVTDQHGVPWSYGLAGYGRTRATTLWLVDDAYRIMADSALLGGVGVEWEMRVPAGTWLSAGDIVRAVHGRRPAKGETSSLRAALRRHNAASKVADEYPRQMVRLYPIAEYLLAAAGHAEAATSPDCAQAESLMTSEQVASCLAAGSGLDVVLRAAAPAGAEKRPTPIPGGRRLAVVEVRRIETVPARCLTVEASDGMFLADDFLPTHNTWTAEAMMAFWQAYPHSFKELPGSASDTKYAIENAIARVPIWVADDLAPNADKRKADAEQSKIGSIVRMIFNGNQHRRMHSGGEGEREALDPRAVFVATAENKLAGGSEMDRLMHISTGDRFLNSTAHTRRIEMMNATTVTQNMVAAACVMTIAGNAARLTWPHVRDYWVRAEASATDEARFRVSGGADATRAGDASRHAQIAGDLSLGLRVLLDTCDRLEMDEEVDLINTLFDDLYSIVSDCFTAQKSTTYGASLLQALRSVLASGQAHVAAPGLAGPPVPASAKGIGEDAPWINQRLGWPIPADAGDSPRPSGPTIGYVVAHRDGTLHVLFEPKAAFAIAQKHYPELLQAGTFSDSGWASIWSEDLASTGWQRKRGGSGLTSLVRARKVEGVPITLNTLLGLESESESEDDVEVDEGADVGG